MIESEIPLEKFNEHLDKFTNAENINGQISFFYSKIDDALNTTTIHIAKIPSLKKDFYINIYRKWLKENKGQLIIPGLDDVDESWDYSFDIEQLNYKKFLSLSEQRTHRDLTPEAVEFLKSFIAYQNSLEDLQNVVIKFFKESVMQTKNLQAFMQSDAVGISEMEAIQSVFKHSELIIDGIKKSREATNLIFEKWKI